MESFCSRKQSVALHNYSAVYLTDGIQEHGRVSSLVWSSRGCVSHRNLEKMKGNPSRRAENIKRFELMDKTVCLFYPLQLPIQHADSSRAVHTVIIIMPQHMCVHNSTITAGANHRSPSLYRSTYKRVHISSMFSLY